MGKNIIISSDEKIILKEWRLLKKQRNGEIHIDLCGGWVSMHSSVPRLSRALLHIKKYKKIPLHYFWRLSYVMGPELKNR